MIKDKNKNKTNYVIEIPLKCNQKEEDILNRELDKFRIIANEIRREVIKDINRMKITHQYKNIGITDDIVRQFKLKEYDLHNRFKYLSKKYKVNASMVQKTVSELYPSIEGAIYKGTKIRYKRKDKYGKLSMSAKGRQGLILVEEVVGNKDKNKPEHLKYKVKYMSTHRPKRKITLMLNLNISPKDTYNYQLLKENYDKYKYLRIVRKCIKGKNRYYLQIIVDGVPPIKYSNKGEVKGINNIGLESKGNVGIDIGTSTIASVSEVRIHKHELGCYRRKKEYYIKLTDKINQNKRELDRLKIKNNPLYYKSNGVRKSKKQVREEGLKWKESKRMIKLRLKIKELHRLISENVKLDHNEFVNDLIKEGINFKVETMNFSGLSKRSKKETEINQKTGKNKRKKRYGKSINRHSPAMLLSILDRKLKYIGEGLIKINTKEVKASQYNHQTKEYVKKNLSDRGIEIILNNDNTGNNNKIQMDRDIYSAYLISQVEYDEGYVKRIIKEKEIKSGKKLGKKAIEKVNGWVSYNNSELERLYTNLIKLNKEYEEGISYNVLDSSGLKVNRVIKSKLGCGIISEVV